MNQQKGTLPEGSYGGISGKDFKPYIASSRTDVVETSISSLLIGLFAALLFAMSNTYLSLKVGLTIAAGIPASILGVGLLKLLKKNSILQNGIIQGMASMGDSIAAGVVFTTATLLLWNVQISFLQLLTISFVGAGLGIFLVMVFKNTIIIDEHGKDLKFPESMAIAEVVVNASEGESEGFKAVMQGFLVGGFYKFFLQGLGFVKEEVAFPLWKTQFGFQLFPSLLGLGYIIGPKLASYVFAGGLLAWFGIIPLISFLGSYTTVLVHPGTQLISQMAPSDIWNSYVRYIGAGAVTMAGFLSLGKNLPSIFSALAEGFKKKDANSAGVNPEQHRFHQGTPMTIIIAIIAVLFLMLCFTPAYHGGILMAFVTVFFIFFFGIVSARMCGVVGASNNAVSGMTIASLLIITTVLKLTTGLTGQEAMTQSILLGSIVCIGVAVSGGYIQSLKVGFILGNTTKKMDMYLLLASVFAVTSALGTLLIMHKAYGIGSVAAPAPQASLMRVIVEGVLGGNLPWDLIFIGAALALFIFILELPVLVIAIGIYLPFGLTTSILLGGLLFAIVSRLNKKDPVSLKRAEQTGVVFASGLIAGDAIAGVILAVSIIFGINLSKLGSGIGIFNGASGEVISLVAFFVLCLYIVLKFNYKKTK